MAFGSQISSKLLALCKTKLVRLRNRRNFVAGEHGKLASGSRYDFIDVTRALAAFIVVVSHAQGIIIDRPLTPGTVHRALSMITTQGHNAVVVFFVISGFWIVRSVLRAGDNFSFRDYMLARGTRLWIVLLPALLLGAGIDLLGDRLFASPLYAGTQGALSMTYDVSERLSLPVFLGNLAFLQDIAVPPLGSNGPLWTIACEFWYYVYVPLAWLALRSRNWLGMTAAAVALFFLPALHLFACWMMGGVAYVLAERRGPIRDVHWTRPAAALGLFGLAIVLLKLFPLHWVVDDLLLAATFALFLGLGIRSPFGQAKGLGLLARFGSRSSYSLYATHMPVLVFLCNFVVPSARIPAGLYSWMLVLLIPLVAVLVAIPFSRLTEDRTPAARRWLSGLLAPTAGVPGRR